MRRHSLVTLALCALLAIASPSAPACWDDAAQRSGVSADLLTAIARVESNLNPYALNRSHLQRTGSYDIGLMQINSRLLPILAHHGIREADLLEPCTNIRVGAWLLADLFARMGATWEAVGAYNAACTRIKPEACRKVRSQYAWRVYRRITPRGKTDSRIATLPVADLSPTLLAVRVAP